MIFTIIAVPFGSYGQPFIIMSSVPFGFAGAILAHLMLGYDLSIMPFFGILALTGVVVNDSLIMVDFIRRYKNKERTRFNAIMLSTWN